MNYYMLDKVNKEELEITRAKYEAGEVLKVTLLNINFTFSCDNSFNEKTDIIEPTEHVKIAPVVNKKNTVKKSNRGKKTNKKLEKKMNKFGSNIKFKVYDEIYDDYFTVIVFRKNSGDIPGLVCTDYELVRRLVDKVINVINTQYPDKNFKYIDYKINLCNLNGRIELYNKTINVYILRDILYIIHDIYNSNLHDLIIKKKYIEKIKEIDSYDTDIILKENFVDCIFKENNVYLSIKYRIQNKIITTKMYNNGKMYILGSKNILGNYNILYNLKHIVYRYNSFIL